MTIAIAWSALARLHLGWAVFVLICTTATMLMISVALHRRLRMLKVALLLPSLAVVYPFSLMPVMRVVETFVHWQWIDHRYADRCMMMIYEPMFNKDHQVIHPIVDYVHLKYQATWRTSVPDGEIRLTNPGTVPRYWVRSHP